MAREKQIEQQASIQEKKSSKRDYISAVGRRREATARARIYPGKQIVLWGSLEVGKGEIFVNQIPIDNYFSDAVSKAKYLELLKVTNIMNKFPITVKVTGGGKVGQLDAALHAVARALNLLDKEKFHGLLRKKGYLTRDARTRERRKVGTGGKARRKKQSPKR